MTVGLARGVLPLAATVAVVLLALAGEPAWGAEASSTPGPGGDPRSPGQGPGLVGDPAFALGAVLVVGLLSVALTLAYVRLTARRRTGPQR